MNVHQNARLTPIDGPGPSGARGMGEGAILQTECARTEPCGRPLLPRALAGYRTRWLSSIMAQQVSRCASAGVQEKIRASGKRANRSSRSKVKF